VPRLASKVKRREDTRERKAESAAKVERAIERELIERLRSGAYGDRPLNVEEGVWKKVLRGLERAEKGKDLADEEELEEEDGVGEVEYVSDVEESEIEMEGEMEDFDDWLGGKSADEEEGDDDEDSEEEDSSGSSDTEGSHDEATTTPGTKRKRQAPPPNARKKPATESIPIEYEIEDNLPERETLLA
jgi:protein MAK16